MKNTLTRITTAGAMLCAVAVGCAAEKTGPALTGKVNVTPKPISALTAGEATAASICATFTLQPYQFTGTGGAPQNAGNPITFTSSGPAEAFYPGAYPFSSTSFPAYLNGSGNQTDQEVVGCAPDGPQDPSLPTSSTAPNWGYFVTISNFEPCLYNPADGATAYAAEQDLAAALQSIAPIGQNYEVYCQNNQDATLPTISATIDIPVTIQSGYVDVSASISDNQIAVGCKIADQDTAAGGDGNLHFGTTYQTPSGGAPTSISTFTWTNAAGPIQQFSGTINDNASSDVDFYTTGIIPWSQVQASGASNTIVYQMINQTGNVPCVASVANGGAPSGPSSGFLYTATGLAQCKTTYNNAGSGIQNTADLAGAVEIQYNTAWATATVRDFIGYYWYIDILYGSGSIYDFTASSTSDTQVSGAAQPNWNNNVAEANVPISNWYTVNGVYPNLTDVWFDSGGNWHQQPGTFWVTAFDNPGSGDAFQGEEIFALVGPGGVGTWAPIPANASCLGIYSSAATCAAPDATGASPCAGVAEGSFGVP